MNWKLILGLSLFGAAMGFATVYWFSSKMEPFFWVPIFVLCAFLIARNVSKKAFLHGFMVGLMNCAWITLIHTRFSDAYLVHHPKEAAQYMKMHMESGATVAQCILLTNIVAGLISGVVLGLFANIATGYIRKNT